MTLPDLSSTVESASPSLAPNGVELRLENMPIKIVRIALRSLEYKELAPNRPARILAANQQVKVSLAVRAELRLAVEGAEVLLEVVVNPDSEFIPTEVRASLSAYFSREPTVSDEQLKQFAAGPALRILYPYIRELVSSITARGLYSQVWLDPIQAQFLLDRKSVV